MCSPARGQHQCCRPVRSDRVVERGDERRVELGDQDADRAAAREADLERLVVCDSVLAQASGAAVQHLLRFPDHGRLDAATGDGPCDLAQVVEGE